MYLQCWSHGKDTKQLENKQKKKKTFFCRKSKASGSKKPKTEGNQNSLFLVYLQGASLEKQGHFVQRAIFFSLLFIKLLSSWWFWITAHHLSHNPSVQVLTPNATTHPLPVSHPADATGFPSTTAWTVHMCNSQNSVLVRTTACTSSPARFPYLNTPQLLCRTCPSGHAPSKSNIQWLD